MPIILVIILVVGALFTGSVLEKRVRQPSQPTPTISQEEIQEVTPSPTFQATSTPNPEVAKPSPTSVKTQMPTPKTPSPTPMSSSTPEPNYTEYYNNALKYFGDIESCYNKAVSEVKSGDVPAMTATVDECQNITRNARKEIDKLYYAPNLARVNSNLGSAWGWYLNVLNGMWILGVEIASPPYDISNSLKTKDAAMSTARSYVEGAKREWEAANK